MSYDISLCDPVTKETLFMDSLHQMNGGTYAIGGTSEMQLNITYNYARWYKMHGVFGEEGKENKGIRTIYGLSGAESIPILKHAIETLEKSDKDISEDERKEFEEHGATGYWMPTRENAIKPLYYLWAFAQLRPDGIWEGD